MPNPRDPPPDLPIPADSASVVHELVLEFHRVLTVEEWMTVGEAAQQLPYVQHLRAEAVPITRDED